MANREKRTYSKCRGYDRKEVGKRIYEAWKASGLSQSKFIAGAGIGNDRFLRKVMHGEKGLSTCHAISLAWRHKLSLDYLYRGIGQLHYEGGLHREIWTPITDDDKTEEVIARCAKQVAHVTERIKDVRSGANLSQAELGRRIGYSRYTIIIAENRSDNSSEKLLSYDYDLITNNLPTLDFLVLFANEFNISLDELIF